ncbi:MAG: hypothetical protein COY42_27705, partial [Armatimonadetes bacterium CG_4_10_14_0_8_um_filter_66_14]
QDQRGGRGDSGRRLRGTLAAVGAGPGGRLGAPGRRGGGGGGHGPGRAETASIRERVGDGSPRRHRSARAVSPA